MTAVLDPATINVTIDFDHMGRVYAIVPDEVAHRMRVAALAHWVPGFEGHSETFPADHWFSAVCRTILAAVADFATDERDREQAARWGKFYGFVVGERGWDEQAKWWKDYRNTRAYVLPGSISALPDRSGRFEITN